MTTALFAIILMLVNIIQAITGFAGAPLAMPLCIALVGISDAKASITLIFLLSSAVVTFSNLKYIAWKKLAVMILLMIIGIIPGLWLYDKLPIKALMIIYAVIVILIGIWKLLARNSGDLKKPWTYVTLIMAGIMQGMFTSGGPFVALYASSEIKEKKIFRATVSSVWTILNIYLCWNMYRQGMYTENACQLTLWSLLPVAAGIVMGSLINRKIKQTTFLKLVYVLLILSGGTLLFNAF